MNSPSLSTADAAALTSDLPVPQISEVVLRTSNYDRLQAWYGAVLGTKPFFEHVKKERFGVEHDPGAKTTSRLDDFVRFCFIRVRNEYPYTQSVTLFDVPNLERSHKVSGLHHIQLRQASIEVLFTRFERLRTIGIEPFECHNHGPSTSFYYLDPDENIVEASASNFPTEAEYLGYFKSETFAKNPYGVEINPADVIARFRKGEPLSNLLKVPG